MRQKLIGLLQTLARSLMIPVAVLPAAAILQRIGKFEFDHPILIQIAEVCKLGGNAIFDNLPLLFAVGIAIGMTAGEGIAALSAVVGYLVFQNVLGHFDLVVLDGMEATPVDMGVLGGILVGFIAVFYYRRYKNLRLPAIFAYFSGKRFVPIITSLTMVLVGVVMGLIWPTVQEWIRSFGMWTMSAGGSGVFVYGFLNRLLIPTGLHHILNSIAWYQIGDFIDAGGKLIHGDMTRFFAGDANAGMFMAGFYPVMLFGLPAAALAMMRYVHPNKRKAVATILLSAGLISFFTGITEPIEFMFMFSAPVLFAVHAVLTGASLMLMHLLDIKLGFSFSAGLIDLTLTWDLGYSQTLLFLLVGIGYFATYYFIFRAMIRVLRLQTPGRELDDDSSNLSAAAVQSYTIEQQAEQVLKQVGGLNNIAEVDACFTRLRLKLRNEVELQEREFTKLGAYGMLNMGRGHVHIIFGVDSELIKDSILNLMKDRGLGGVV